MEATHKYHVTASSATLRSGFVVAEGIEPPVEFSAPPEFQGQTGVWTPEHFFVAAVASCFTSTFSGMSAASKFEFLSLDLETEGILEKDQIGWRFTEVKLRPKLRILTVGDVEQANRLLQKAEKSCLVGRSLGCPLVLEPEIVTDENPVNSLCVGTP